MKVSIIGGGIIGLCSAYYLAEQGATIELIDRTDFSEGCSFGNAGMIVPSHFIPLATPGIIAKGIRWMFNPKSPFYIRPRLNLELAQWLWQFYRSCDRQKVDRAVPLLRDLGLFSKKLYQDLATKPDLKFDFEERGLMMLCKSSRALKEEIETAELANSIGIKASVLDAEQVKIIENGIPTDVTGAVFYPGDAHLYPDKLMTGLLTYLKKRGVIFHGRTEVQSFTCSNQQIEMLHTNNGKIPVKDRQVLIAGGAWTAKLLKQLSLKMLLQDGKGYSITLQNLPKRPRIPSILAEAKVAITPMGNDLRIGGTLEISNLSRKINKKRVEGILEAVPEYFPALKPGMPEDQFIWHGFRPCTPDGLPYLGRAKQFENLTLATGHAMMGLSLGPATGKLIAELMLNQKLSLPIDAFNPHRF